MSDLVSVHLPPLRMIRHFCHVVKCKMINMSYTTPIVIPTCFWRESLPEEPPSLHSASCRFPITTFGNDGAESFPHAPFFVIPAYSPHRHSHMLLAGIRAESTPSSHFAHALSLFQIPDCSGIRWSFNFRITIFTQPKGRGAGTDRKRTDASASRRRRLPQ